MTQLCRRLVLVLLAACALGLTGCDGNPPEVRNQDLGAITIPGVEPFGYRDNEAEISLSVTSSDVRDEIRTRGKSGRLDAWEAIADGRTSIDAMAHHLDQTLGSAWQRSQGFYSLNKQVEVLVWETQGKPKRYYALIVYDKPSELSDGRVIRPMIVTYSKVTPPSFWP